MEVDRWTYIIFRTGGGWELAPSTFPKMIDASEAAMRSVRGANSDHLYALCVVVPVKVTAGFDVASIPPDETEAQQHCVKEGCDLIMFNGKRMRNF